MEISIERIKKDIELLNTWESYRFQDMEVLLPTLSKYLNKKITMDNSNKFNKPFIQDMDKLQAIVHNEYYPWSTSFRFVTHAPRLLDIDVYLYINFNKLFYTRRNMQKETEIGELDNNGMLTKLYPNKPQTILDANQIIHSLKLSKQL